MCYLMSLLYILRKYIASVWYIMVYSLWGCSHQMSPVVYSFGTGEKRVLPFAGGRFAMVSDTTPVFPLLSACRVCRIFRYCCKTHPWLWYDIVFCMLAVHWTINIFWIELNWKLSTAFYALFTLYIPISMRMVFALMCCVLVWFWSVLPIYFKVTLPIEAKFHVHASGKIWFRS